MTPQSLVNETNLKVQQEIVNKILANFSYS